MTEPGRTLCHYFNVNKRSHCPVKYLIYEAPTPIFENISPRVLRESMAGSQPRARVGACASCSMACMPVPPGSVVTRWATCDPGCSGVGLGGQKEPRSHCFSPQSALFGLVLASAFWPDCTAPFLPPTRSGLQLPQCQRHFCLPSLMVD